ncbi:hypothetical protein [Streptomyces sp. HUAS TT20]|uniref:hypothetical protein n=1 Tax=Streptomyces sp. HUAS TT20 TaxID=3447509 RepID=UPI0021D7D382|nr:hypothetical protein [Streptomyces sp. HUAS 15-9]UXY33030.1 hypothetical protein N8I87_42745 [Streptomyces sp. HUAS 15-9]
MAWQTRVNAGMTRCRLPRRTVWPAVWRRALADRGAARDLIDVHAAAATRTLRDLERLGERHGRGEFRLQDLRERLGGVDWIDDDEFAVYGLTPEETAALRIWAQHWVNDLDQRLDDTGADDYDD